MIIDIKSTDSAYFLCLPMRTNRLCAPLVLSLERRTNFSPLNVGEGSRRRRLYLDDVLGVTLSSIARASISTIQPLHEATLVPPDAHSKDHAAAQRITHTLHRSQLHERISALSGAVRVVHGDIFRLVLEDDPVLNVLALDRLEHAVLGWELGDYGKGLLGVDLEPGAIEVLHVVAVRVIAAPVLVAKPGGTALGTLALEETGLAARVRCNLVGAAVGLPDIHFIAADAGAIDVALA